MFFLLPSFALKLCCRNVFHTGIAVGRAGALCAIFVFGLHTRGKERYAARIFMPAIPGIPAIPGMPGIPGIPVIPRICGIYAVAHCPHRLCHGGMGRGMRKPCSGKDMKNQEATYAAPWGNMARMRPHG